MPATWREIVGVTLLGVGILVLFVTYPGAALLPLLLGAFLVWSGAASRREEEIERRVASRLAQLGVARPEPADEL